MKIIPQEVLDNGYNSAVHVESWNPAARFFYIETKEGIHYLKTGKKPVKYFQTSNNLIYTRKNENTHIN